MSQIPDDNDALMSLVQRLDRTADLPANRVIAFIAARPHEGTSTVAQAYARAVAAIGDQRVLLIDAGRPDDDLYHSNGADLNTTIAETLSAGAPLTDALFPLNRHLHLGRLAKDGRERAVVGKLTADDGFWETLHETFTTVVIDAPSLKESSDGLALAAHADATVLVVEAEKTRAPVVENLRDSLVAAGAKIAGVVMNKRHFYIPEKVYQNL